MAERKTLDRREFTVAAALAALSGVAITISACGSSSPTASTPPPSAGGGGGAGGAADKTGAISANHGHSAIITSAKLTAAAAVSLDIQGTATHTHTVELTAAQITSIAGGTQVAKESTNDSGHSHTVTFN